MLFGDKNIKRLFIANITTLLHKYIFSTNKICINFLTKTKHGQRFSLKFTLINHRYNKLFLSITDVFFFGNFVNFIQTKIAVFITFN